MQKLYVGLLVAALAAVAMPVNAATSTTYEKNVAFLLGMMGEVDLEQTATLSDGRVMSLGDAIDVAAARAGNVDLAAIASGQAPPPGVNAGDVWVLEFGSGGCAVQNLAPQPVFQAPHPQAWIYSGGVGTLETSNGAYTYIIGWTTKTSSLNFGTAGFSLTGSQDFFCVSFFGYHLAFPFGDGVAQLN